MINPQVQMIGSAGAPDAELITPGGGIAIPLHN